MISNMFKRWALTLPLAVIAGPQLQAQWSAVAGLEYAVITCFLATDDSTFYVGGHQGLLKRSTDRGATWVSIWGNGVRADTIMALGAGGGYVFVGTYGLNSVSRSTNQGNDWTVANTGLPPNLLVYQFEMVGDTLFVCGATGVYASPHLGDTWQEVDVAGMNGAPGSGQFAHPRSIAAGNGMLYCATEYKGVFSTPRGPFAWTNIGTPSSGASSIVVIDTNVFVATYTKVYVYSGSGTAWIERSTGLPDYLYSPILKSAGGMLLLYSGYGLGGDGIYVSEDLGITWTTISLAELTTTLVNSMVVTNTEVILGTPGGAWRIPMASLVTSVEQDGPLFVPDGMALMQNYPNPFNPATVIRYWVTGNGGRESNSATGSPMNIRLRVHDLLGREVAQLVNGPVSAGTHSVVWDASGVPSGTYYCRLDDGSSSVTMKMVLLR